MRKDQKKNTIGIKFADLLTLIWTSLGYSSRHRWIIDCTKFCWKYL